MKVPVSIYIVAKAISPLCSPSDDVCMELSDADVNNEEEVRAIIREKVVPHFQSYTEDSQRKIKDSLKYFICTNNPSIDRLFPAFHLPFEPPESAQSFFSIVWEEFFGSTLKCSVDPDQYEEKNDDDFINSLYKNGYPKEN